MKRRIPCQMRPRQMPNTAALSPSKRTKPTSDESIRGAHVDDVPVMISPHEEATMWDHKTFEAAWEIGRNLEIGRHLRAMGTIEAAINVEEASEGATQKSAARSEENSYEEEEEVIFVAVRRPSSSTSSAEETSARLPSLYASDAEIQSAASREMEQMVPQEDDPGWYEGELNDRLQRHGLGFMQYDSGLIYRGYFLNNKHHGVGKLLIPGGVLYEGSFVNDKFDVGALHFPDGRVRVCQYRDDKPVGEGALWSADRRTVFRTAGNDIVERIPSEEAERIASRLNLPLPA